MKKEDKKRSSTVKMAAAATGLLIMPASIILSGCTASTTTPSSTSSSSTSTSKTPANLYGPAPQVPNEPSNKPDPDVDEPVTVLYGPAPANTIEKIEKTGNKSATQPEAVADLYGPASSFDPQDKG